MRHRHAITAAAWERSKDLLPGRPGQPGVTAKDNRLFVDAVLWLAKTGAPWRDLPERFGPWNSIWRRFARWARKGGWRRLFAHVQDSDLEWLVLDSTIIRAQPHAAGARKQQDGRGAGRPGVGTQSRRLWDQNPHGRQWPAVTGGPVRDSGPAADVSHAQELLHSIPAAAEVQAVIADKGYDSQAANNMPWRNMLQHPLYYVGRPENRLKALGPRSRANRR